MLVALDLVAAAFSPRAHSARLSLDMTSQPATEYVRLQSADGHEFIVPLDVACVSRTMRVMLRGAGTFKESEAIIRLATGATTPTPSSSTSSLLPLDSDDDEDSVS